MVMVTAWVVVVHLVLLPALYFGMGYVIRESHEDLFIEHARTFSRVLADEFEVGAAISNLFCKFTLSTIKSISSSGRPFWQF